VLVHIGARTESSTAAIRTNGKQQEQAGQLLYRHHGRCEAAENHHAISCSSFDSLDLLNGPSDTRTTKPQPPYVPIRQRPKPFAILQRSITTSANEPFVFELSYSSTNAQKPQIRIGNNNGEN
jgi:hypothetical protein